MAAPRNKYPLTYVLKIFGLVLHLCATTCSTRHIHQSPVVLTNVRRAEIAILNLEKI
jgi:hypothetical protein